LFTEIEGCDTGTRRHGGRLVDKSPAQHEWTLPFDARAILELALTGRLG